MKFLIVTGLSGAGKSEAVRTLEDAGYFCVDNLPPGLIPRFVEMMMQSDGQLEKVALVSDIRGGDLFNEMFQALEEIERAGLPYTIIYLEADEEALIRRYKFTRRRHPLADACGGILEAIREENRRLEQIRGKAHKIIDTTEVKPKQLREELLSFLAFKETEVMTVAVVSFGFKHGLPPDLDLLFDVRFLPNPHYVESLKPLTGENPAVYDYVFKWPVAQHLWDRLQDMISFLLPQFAAEGRTHVMIGIGCTGGQHRSVAIAGRLGKYLLESGFRASVDHRDIERR